MPAKYRSHISIHNSGQAPDGPSRLPPATFLAVVEEHGQFLEHYIRSRGVDYADVNDVLHDVYVAAYGALDRFDPARGDLRTWLAGIAFRQVSLYWRRARRHPECSRDPNDLERLPDIGEDAEHHVRKAKRKAVLNQLLKKIPPERAAVLMEHRGHGTPLAEIAMSEGIPIGTVKSRARLGWNDVQREKRRWQARQRKGHDIVPVVVAGLLSTRRAWAAAVRTLSDRKPKLRLVGALAAWAVLLVALWTASPIQPGSLVRDVAGAASTPDALPAVAASLDGPSVVGAAPLPAVSPAGLVAAPVALSPQPTAPAVRARLGNTLHPGGASQPRRPVDNEPELYQRALATLRARNYQGASSLFDQHTTEHPGSGHAGERAALATRSQRSVSATTTP